MWKGDEDELVILLFVLDELVVLVIQLLLVEQMFVCRLFCGMKNLTLAEYALDFASCFL